jgi:hypothetical protein
MQDPLSDFDSRATLLTSALQPIVPTDLIPYEVKRFNCNLGCDGVLDVKKA